jgi:hypothetical protein
VSARIWRKRRARRWVARLSPGAVIDALVATHGAWRALAVRRRLAADPVAFAEGLTGVTLAPWQADMLRGSLFRGSGRGSSGSGG